MRAIWRIFAMIAKRQRWVLLRGALLSFLVLIAGLALLGVSGWFITAAAAAGLAGVGAVFDVFRPSAAIRFLALGRTVARYGERIWSHDATLRALAEVRVALLGGLLRASHAAMSRLRGGQTLNRLIADVDALDGIPLRLVLPIGAGLAALFSTFMIVWWQAGFLGAIWLTGVCLVTGAGVLFALARAAYNPARMGERAMQAFRSRLIDLIRLRNDLAVYGMLETQRAHVLAADQRSRTEKRRLFRYERLAGAVLSLAIPLAVTGSILIGTAAVETGQLAPAFAALLVFVGLALGEVIMPLRRAGAELGRMADAAKRVEASLGTRSPATPSVQPEPATASTSTALSLNDITYRYGEAEEPVLSQFSLDLMPGERVALVGPSGGGKSTILLIAARLELPESGAILLAGSNAYALSENQFRQRVTMLSQRAALLSGSIRDALVMAKPDLTDDEAWHVLDAVCLKDLAGSRGGLDFGIGESGRRVSGGEGRRLALARTLLMQPDVLLLDEVTEGLDEKTALAVLEGIRAFCPDSAVLLAAHRPAEQNWADRIVRLV